MIEITGSTASGKTELLKMIYTEVQNQKVLSPVIILEAKHIAFNNLSNNSFCNVIKEDSQEEELIQLNIKLNSIIGNGLHTTILLDDINTYLNNDNISENVKQDFCMLLLELDRRKYAKIYVTIPEAKFLEKLRKLLV